MITSTAELRTRIRAKPAPAHRSYLKAEKRQEYYDEKVGEHRKLKPKTCIRVIREILQNDANSDRNPGGR
ncbi:hypothetical protein NicSoilB8_08340 [Arthrobacter sp. NicSoilB8]|nr:hypothetical protein NicSoilB8_08340 [Arthrobacter sp. NicSoilB8]